ncbi:hypothetical protein FNV43_RR20129 [Rhamnella rubrinervis]|uniref:Uncharacterized protein n=1 Tax=Rhamnella rubrinervis TaxID=2594499 RepID=A0A8K0DVD2_9ROSA|nr:hypothetical protein FNV43_RR20129 [Rhamnella rubrinervis]
MSSVGGRRKERVTETEGKAEATEMSLVDYASSDDDDGDVTENPAEKPENESDHPTPSHRLQEQGSSSVSSKQPESSHSTEEPSIEKLPDAALLLNSAAFSTNSWAGKTDHSSRVAAAMAESASRKRDSKGLASSLTRSKLPKGTFPHSKNIPDTGDGMLVPPQLSGRSNVVTEDIGKLFVKKKADSHHS